MPSLASAFGLQLSSHCRPKCFCGFAVTAARIGACWSVLELTADLHHLTQTSMRSGRWCHVHKSLRIGKSTVCQKPHVFPHGRCVCIQIRTLHVYATYCVWGLSRKPKDQHSCNLKTSRELNGGENKGKWQSYSVVSVASCRPPPFPLDLLTCAGRLMSQRTKVCRYNWHSAGSLGRPFPALKYKYIFWEKTSGGNFIKQHSKTVMLW